MGAKVFLNILQKPYPYLKINIFAWRSFTIISEPYIEFSVTGTLKFRAAPALLLVLGT
jgi:hypothetical protein